MSIFDKLKPTATPVVETSNKKINASETFTFDKLPESLDELKALPISTLDSPHKTAALTVCALCVYAADKNIGIEMLNFLRGPRPLSPMEIQFLDDRFRGGKYYVPFSYFEGTSPENDYTPATPFKLTFNSNPYSADNEGYYKLYINSSGADSPRQVTLRMKGDGRWFLWEQYIMVGIRQPKSKDPWA